MSYDRFGLKMSLFFKINLSLLNEDNTSFYKDSCANIGLNNLYVSSIS